MDITLSEFLGVVVYFALTFMLELIPPLKWLWWRVSGERKPLVLLLLAIAIVAATMGLQCAGIETGAPLVCPEDGLWAQTIFSLVLGIIAWTASQMTFPTMQGPLGDRMRYRLPMNAGAARPDEFGDVYDEGDSPGFA